jgi:hypothetical protein
MSDAKTLTALYPSMAPGAADRPKTLTMAASPVAAIPTREQAAEQRRLETMYPESREMFRDPPRRPHGSRTDYGPGRPKPAGSEKARLAALYPEMAASEAEKTARVQAADGAEAERLRDVYPAMFAEKADGAAKPAARPNAAELVIDLPKDLAPGVSVNDATIAEFKAVASEVGLSSEVASRIVAFDLERQRKAFEAWDAEQERWQSQMVTKERDVVEAVDAALHRLGAQSLAGAVVAAGPDVMRLIAKLSRGTR